METWTGTYLSCTAAHPVSHTCEMQTFPTVNLDVPDFYWIDAHWRFHGSGVDVVLKPRAQLFLRQRSTALD